MKLKKFLWTIVLIFSLIFIEFSANSANASSPIKGTVEFTQHVTSALNFIYKVDPEHYRLIRYINLIEQNDKTWSWIFGYNGVCKVELSLVYATWKYDNVFQLAGDLVHEGSLCKDYFDGNTSNVRADEIRALKVQRDFYIKSGAQSYLVDYMNQLISQNWPWGK